MDLCLNSLEIIFSSRHHLSLRHFFYFDIAIIHIPDLLIRVQSLIQEENSIQTGYLLVP
jgi:hypothetical protein